MPDHPGNALASKIRTGMVFLISMKRLFWLCLYFYETSFELTAPELTRLSIQFYRLTTHNIKTKRTIVQSYTMGSWQRSVQGGEADKADEAE